MTVATARAGSREWLLGNPWWWMGLGLGFCALAWAWMAAGGHAWPGVRYGLIAGGLLAAAGAVIIRLGFTQPPYLGRLGSESCKLVLLTLAGLFALMSAGVTLLVVLSFFRWLGVSYSWGQLSLWWFAVAPMSGTAATQCWRRMRENRPLEEREEAAALLLLAALACFCCCQALYDPGDVLFMDTMRLFLGVLTLVPLVAAPLVLVPQNVRRGLISFLIVLHFGGVLTAAFAAPPTPLVISQLWTRIYRPYLEFVYLTNAYHFYAPEPGPASYLWFRIQYEDGKGNEAGEWLKVPTLDDKTSRHRHSTGLTYQRYLVVTESTIAQDPVPAFFIVHGDGKAGPAPFFLHRTMHLPQSVLQVGVLGVAEQKVKLAVPWHPEIPYTNQYLPVSPGVKFLLQSYARHVAAEVKPDEGYTVKSIKIYRVVHLIPSMQAYLHAVTEPTDPDTYRAIYYGEFDPRGAMLDPSDPFLYWILPTIKESPERDSRYKCYARKHAGDPNWLRNEQGQWVDH